MSVNVTEAGPFEKLVSFTVSEAELEAAKSKAARRLSREVNIRGFRPGKAPRPIVEATVGRERLRSEAIDELLPEKVGSVLIEQEIAPAVNPQLERIEDTDDGVEVDVRVTLWPTLDEVPEIHDRTIEVGAAEVTEEELEDQLDRIRDQFAQLETADRPAEPGDFVSVDIRATHDGETVEEATADQLLYEIGSSGFIDGVDDVLEGASAGDVVTFEGTLPEGFGDRAGQAVTYTITVGDVREKRLPEITDEWAAEMTEFETAQELIDSLRGQLSGMKKQALSNQFRQKALDDLVEQVDIELPEQLVRGEMDELLHRFAHRLEEQNISLEDYFRVSGQSQDAFVEDLRAQAGHSIRTRLLLEAVADQEGIEVSDDELSAMVEAVASQAENPDEIRAAFGGGPQRQSLSGDILRNKALEAIVAGAVPVDEDGNPVDLVVEPEPLDEVVAGEIVEGDVVEGEVVEGEVVAGPVDDSEEE